MIETASRNILAAVSVLTVLATGVWADALGPANSALLATAGGVALGVSVYARFGHRRELSLGRALRRRDEQLAQTAHELRTPLTAIINSLEIVRAGYATTPEEAAGFLAEADLAAHHLAFLINDVLDHAALDAGKLRLEIAPQRVDALIRESQRLLGMQSARHDVQVSADQAQQGLQVRADGRRCLQVLFNLVGNAIKFSEPGRPVQIHVEQDGEMIRFRILDEGPGVPVTLRPKLFTPFAGGPSGHRSDSTGLGLHISKQIVEQMRGSIGYRPRQPVGSEFWFTLPKANDPTIAPVPALTQ